MVSGVGDIDGREAITSTYGRLMRMTANKVIVVLDVSQRREISK